MIEISYIFKPRTRQVDEVAEVVRELQARGLASLTISRFYEYAAEQVLAEYRRDPDSLFYRIDSYQHTRDPSHARLACKVRQT